MIRNGGQVVYETKGDTLVVRVGGEIDHHSAVSVRVGIDEKIAAERPERVLLELSRVEFMDSSGLGLILGRYARTSALGIPIVIRNPSKRHERLFKMAEMQNIVKIEKGEKYENEKDL